MLCTTTITLLLSLSLSIASGHETFKAFPPRNQSVTIHKSPLFNVKIVGGRLAYQHELPWQASVYQCAAGGCSVCGGSLISKNYVLTAAHCVNNVNTFNIGLGTNYFFGVVTQSSSVTIHEGFNPVTLENDVAIVKLKDEQTLSETIQTVELPSQNIGSLDGKVVTISGYGYDGTAISTTLKTVDLKVISNSECSRTFYNVRDSTVCAIGAIGKSACPGDSGGPLVLRESGKNIQIGVASFASNGGCEYGAPTGYARVSSFLPWVSQVTGIPTN